jgi:hypothetical protein
VKYITEAMKASAAGTAGLARATPISSEGLGKAVDAKAAAQTNVSTILTEMAKLKISTFNLADLVVTTDATGEVTVDNRRITNQYDRLVSSGRTSLASEIRTKMVRLGVNPGEIDITLKSAEDAKLGILERIGKKVKAVKK